MRAGEGARFRWWMIPLVVIALPFVIVWVIVVLSLRLIVSSCLHVAAWCWWNPRGRNVLFVYSDSPIWKDYIETEILPVIGKRAVVLNWSERSQWRFGLASQVFRYFGGQREFNPMAAVFQPFRRVRLFRFWEPFRDWKHGQVDPLRQMQNDLFALVQVHRDHPAA